jgi:hypothetical protein
MNRGTGKHFCARSQFPVFQGQNTVRALRQTQIVCSQNRSQVVGLVEALDQFENSLRAPFVQIPCRFVRQKQHGLIHQGSCNRNPLLFAP